MSLKIAANTSLMNTEDIKAYVEMLANAAGATIKDRVGNFSLTDEQIKLFTGLNYDELNSLASLQTSMRNAEGRSVVQALVILLFKMSVSSIEGSEMWNPR